MPQPAGIGQIGKRQLHPAGANSDLFLPRGFNGFGFQGFGFQCVGAS
jgi:hypothetical protein